MNIFESFTKAVPNAGPKARAQVGNAQQLINLLRSRGFNAEADSFEQGLINKIQSKNFSTMDWDFGEIERFYGENIKGAGANREEDMSPQEESRRAAEIAAASQLAEARRKEAESRGVPVDPKVAESIMALIAHDPQAGIKLTDEAFGKPPTIEEKRFEAEMKASDEKQKREDKQKAEEAQVIYAALKRERDQVQNLQKKDISDVVGFTEPVARLGRRGFAEFGADWAEENELLRKNLLKQTSNDILEQAKKIAPVTNTDLTWLQKVTVPGETDTPLVWLDFLKNKEVVLNEKISQIESDPELKSKLNISDKPESLPEQPPDAGTRLRAKDNEKR